MLPIFSSISRTPCPKPFCVDSYKAYPPKGSRKWSPPNCLHYYTGETRGLLGGSFFGSFWGVWEGIHAAHLHRPFSALAPTPRPTKAGMAFDSHGLGCTGLWLAGNEGMEKTMAPTIMGYMRTTIRIHSSIPS